VLPADSLETKWKNQRTVKNNFWYNLKKQYGEYISEGFYKNDIESDSRKLYAQGKYFFLDFNTPKDDYSISYLDISDIIGKDIDLIDIGDFISLKDYPLEFINIENELRVVSISKKLKDNHNISISVERRNKTKELLEQIIKNS